jgi:hypothetical protein
MDQCPLERERYNAFEDEDGCPDIPGHLTDSDTDFDGIPNSLDECPLIPETYNKYQDTDGCPDSVIDTKSRAEETVAQITIFSVLTETEMAYQMQ